MFSAATKAMVALDKAEKQFTAYAEHHRAKGANDKAATNYEYATMCSDALERLRQVCADMATSEIAEYWSHA